jgi:hypothetical protein
VGFDDPEGRGIVSEAAHADPPAQWRGAGLRVPPHVAWTVDEDGSVAIADMRSGARRSMTGAASMIWQATAEGASAPELAEQLLREYAELPTDWPTEVDDFLVSLVSEGLLEPTHSA